MGHLASRGQRQEAGRNCTGTLLSLVQHLDRTTVLLALRLPMTPSAQRYTGSSPQGSPKESCVPTIKWLSLPAPICRTSGVVMLPPSWCKSRTE